MVLHARDYPIKYWQTETYLEIWRALRWWPNCRKAAALIGRETLWDWDWGPGPPNRQSSKSFMFSEKSEFLPFSKVCFIRCVAEIELAVHQKASGEEMEENTRSLVHWHWARRPKLNHLWFCTFALSDFVHWDVAIKTHVWPKTKTLYHKINFDICDER